MNFITNETETGLLTLHTAHCFENEMDFHLSIGIRSGNAHGTIEIKPTDYYSLHQ